jgi:hypothetical protein
LKEVFDFVIINNSCNDKFDAFKKCGVKLQFSFVEVNELLNLFCLTTPLRAPEVPLRHCAEIWEKV